jgi:ABC-type branched-subunit amino acid transport system ATPase component/branched-subunit amino acid ABC-type transport system permease component
MSTYINFLLLGLANGAVYAALGLALVVTYRSSGVLNFATSAIALFSAYMYTSFRSGQFLFLIPGLPQSWQFADSLDFWPAAIAALIVTAVLGLLLYVIIFRFLRNAPAVARAVASLGLMVLLIGVMAQREGTAPPAVSPIFPLSKFTWGSVWVSMDRVYFAAAVVGLALVVWALTRFTRFGLATRAAAASEKGAFVSGISPDRIAALNWMLSTAVAGVAGILIAPIVPLVPAQYTLFIVPALAVALLGGFERMAPVVIGGLAVGMIQSEMTYLQARYTWLPSSGLSEAVPLVLILIVLVARAKPLPGRGAILRRSLGRAQRPRMIWQPSLAGLAIGAVGLFVTAGVTRASLVTSFIFGVIALSYVVVTGYSGQISLAQLTLAGVSGFLLGPLTTEWRLPIIHTFIPFPFTPLVSALGAMLVGVVFAIPAVRIRGLPVAVLTLALAVVLEAGWFNNTDFVSSSGKQVSGPNLFGIVLTTGIGTAGFPRLGFSFMVLIVLVIVAIGVALLRRSRLGTNMLAVRANERSAAAAGVNVVLTKITAFAIGGFVAGLGGALLAYDQGVVTSAPFDVIVGLSVFATAYIAGITSISGAIVAGLLTANGLVFAAFNDWFDLGGWYSAIAGIGLILTVLQNPEGVVRPVHRFVERLRVRGREPTSVAVGAAAAPVGATAPVSVAAALGEPGSATAQLTPEPALAVVPDQPAVAPVLVVRGVGVRYGGVIAVNDVHFEVPSGKIVGLIGPNGAGKTTLIDAISGFTASTGTIQLRGRTISSLAPFQRVRFGLGRTFQVVELYDDLSVTENVIVGQAASRVDVSAEHLERTFDLLGLSSVRDRPAGELSQGTRQLVSIARALVGEPDVLLLDEPAGGLDSAESQWLGHRLRDIRDSGVSVLLIDHDMQLVLDLCDEIQVLNFGEIIAAGTPAAVRADPNVRAAYLGGTYASHHHADDVSRMSTRDS